MTEPGRFDYILEVVRSMTPEEFRVSLVAAGIIDESGRLTEHYRQPGEAAHRRRLAESARRLAEVHDATMRRLRESGD